MAKSSNMATNETKQAFLKSLPVMAGYITLGIGFGLVYTSAGLSPLWAILFSVFVYAGSMQYVSVTLLTSAASWLTMALVTLTVNLRHLFYSLTMLTRYRHAGWYKSYLIFSLTDETFSIVSTMSAQRPSYYFKLSLLNQSYWVLGTVLGVILQETINISFAGVDYSMTALFLVSLTGQIQSRKTKDALLGVLVTLFYLIVLGRDNFLIPSLMTITAILTLATIRQSKSGANCANTTKEATHES